MAGFSNLYCIGGLGGFQGADGINPIDFQILVGDSDRQWLEPRYFDETLKPIGKIRTIIPEGPAHPNSLIDACIAFAPKYFEKCPSLEKVQQALQGFKVLDFDAEKEKIPQSWVKLRKEALPIFEKMHIFKAHLVKLGVSEKHLV